MGKQILSESLDVHGTHPIVHSLEALEQQHDIDLSIEGQYHTLEMLIQQHDELTNSIATLERMHDQISSVSTLTQESREAYAFTLESIFGEHAPDAESISLEGLTDFLGRLRQATANIGGRISRRTKDILSMISEGVEGLKDRLDAINARREEIEDMSRPEGYMKARGGSRLHIDKTMDPEKLAKDIPRVIEGILEYKKGIVEGGLQFIEHIEETQSKINEMDEPTKKQIQKINAQAKKDSESIARNIENTIGDFNGFKLTGGLEIQVYREIKFYIDYTTKTQESPKIAQPINSNKMGAYKEKEEIRIPSPDEIKALQEAMQAILNGMIREHDNMNKLILQSEQAKHTAERVVPIKEKMQYDQDADLGENAANMFGTLIDNYYGNHLYKWSTHVMENILKLENYQYTVARSGVAYLETALKQYP